MNFLNPARCFYNSAKIAVASSVCLMHPMSAMAYKQVDPKVFSVQGSEKILKHFGANDSLLRISRVASDKMSGILTSSMVQRMAKGTLSKAEWENKYMKPDVLYIYKLGQELAVRANKESEKDSANVRELATMFLGYGKHFERLKKYGLSENDILESPECDAHIHLLSKGTSIHEFYVAVLTDMLPYVVFANYLLHSIEPSDNNPWIEYAEKYGNLDNKYAMERMGKIIKIANGILDQHQVNHKTAETLFLRGFTFEEWFIHNAFTDGFTITRSTFPLMPENNTTDLN